MSNISLQRLAYYAAQVFTANILGGLLIFIQPILILRLTQEHALGVFSLLVSWANIGMLLASFGLLTALQRLGSRYSVRHRLLEFKAYDYLRRVSLKNIMLAVTGILICALALHHGEVPAIIFPAIAAVMTSIFYTRWYAILARIRENNFWPNIFDQALREGTFIIIALLALIILSASGSNSDARNWHSEALIAAYMVSAAFSAWATKVYAQSNNLVPLAGDADTKPSMISIARLNRVWSGIAKTSFPSEVGIFLLKRIDVIIVGILISTESAGIYFLLSRLSELPNLLAGAINVIVGPEFAKIRSRGQGARIKTLYLAAAALPCLATAMMIVAVALASAMNLTDWVFGRKLDLTVMYLFLSGYTLYFALGPSSILLTMTGRQKISSVVTCWIVGFHLLAVTLLTSWLAEVGAAIAFCLSINLQKIAELTIIAKKRVNGARATS